ncbi:MAG: hypothetical protein AB8F95_16800 [Bacteroidia bacterium]
MTRFHKTPRQRFAGFAVSALVTGLCISMIDPDSYPDHFPNAQSLWLFPASISFAFAHFLARGSNTDDKRTLQGLGLAILGGYFFLPAYTTFTVVIVWAGMGAMGALLVYYVNYMWGHDNTHLFYFMLIGALGSGIPMLTWWLLGYNEINTLGIHHLSWMVIVPITSWILVIGGAVSLNNWDDNVQELELKGMSLINEIGKDKE